MLATRRTVMTSQRSRQHRECFELVRLELPQDLVNSAAVEGDQQCATFVDRSR